MAFARFDRGEPDPRQTCPVGAYLTDEDKTALLEVLESDWAGVLCANLATEFLVDVDRRELMQHWHRVRPLAAA
jgi:hypothetical protein